MVAVLLSAALSLFLTSDASAAGTTNIDWKLFGSAAVDGQSLCFYDAASIVRKFDGHIRVWWKCVPQAALDNAENDKRYIDSIVDNAAKKYANGYVPPLSKLENLSGDQRLDAIGYEATADIVGNGVESQMTILSELDCSRRMTRQLSAFGFLNGKFGSDNRQRQWEYTPPEGNGAILLKLLCSK